MTDERNFRSSYYEKVGFRSVEEKKSLEILLKERPLDKAKLKQFCLRFAVPAIYRNLLWKIILGVVPVYTESHAFVTAQRKIEFDDLKRALCTIKTVEENSKPHHLFLTMWILRSRRVSLDMNAVLETPLLKAMSQLAESVTQIIDATHEPVDTFWVLGGLLDIVQKIHGDVGRLQECTCTLLEREDFELHRHLVKISTLQFLPYETWFCSCFAGTISDSSIPKIWDKIVAGSYKILVFVTLVTLTSLRRLLLRCEGIDYVLDCINNISEETAEMIVNKAIELWQQSGSALASMSQITVNSVQNT
ncbi:TBC1 domain family member 7 [Neodiprion virginianus]|uniref:TBC1 domain family member 7 n=1 Tax=Neodiprion virginianus TaxID=2961670 RepID=UPI001EE76E06|nr:TBC1 domain family member 7 [Neodiprion virginianus]